MTDVVAIVDTQEELDFQDAQAMGLRLGVSIPEQFLTIEVFANQDIEDKSREAIFRLERRSHTWVRNAWNSIFCICSAYPIDDAIAAWPNWPNMTLCYDNGTVLSLNNMGPLDATGFIAGVGVIDTGIVVGTNNAPWTFDDIAITIVPNGTGVDELSYQAQQPNEHNGPGFVNQISTNLRYMNNNSGGPIDFEETGWIFAHGGRYLLVSRDVVGTIVVPNMGQLSVTYTMSLTYPL